MLMTPAARYGLRLKLLPVKDFLGFDGKNSRGTENPTSNPPRSSFFLIIFLYSVKDLF